MPERETQAWNAPASRPIHGSWNSARAAAPLSASDLLSTARMQGTSHDDAVDKRLTANQKKYGHQYEFRKA